MKLMIIMVSETTGAIFGLCAVLTWVNPLNVPFINENMPIELAILSCAMLLISISLKLPIPRDA